MGEGSGSRYRGEGRGARGERRGGVPRFARRGMLLVVVLVIIMVLGLVGASFSFRMNADLASVGAMNDLQQARWAAVSGVHRAIFLLRDLRTNTDDWYNNPEWFRRILVWAPGEIGGSDNLANQDKVEGRQAWRFSVVSYEIDGDEANIRYGLTDEASKINLNVASRAQLLALLMQLELKLGDKTPEQLVDALIDWRDTDDTPISLNGAESWYYMMNRNPQHRAKNRGFQTVEELLMVKGFNGRVLYGEDYNRNGWQDKNEDDGVDGVFPPDDGDGELDRGILSLLTVYSWDWNFANDNKRRMPITALSAQVLERPEFEYLAEEIPPEVVDFIVEVRKRGYQFRSVGELLELEVDENGLSNYTEAWAEYDKLVQEMENDRLELEPPEEGEGELDIGDELDEGDLEEAIDDVMGEEGEDDELDGEAEEDDEPDKNSRRRQEIREGGAEGGEGPREGRDRRRGRDRGRRGNRRPVAAPPGAAGNAGDEPAKPTEFNPATAIISPVTPEDMVFLMDRLTVHQTAVRQGLINVNTASPSVLVTIPGLTEEDVESIVGARTRVSGEEKMSLGWLVAQGGLAPQTFALVSNGLTTRSIQFTAQVIGFADHVGTFKRIQVMIEMRGHLAQVKYYRDLTSLGIGYPVFDDERSEGFAFEE